MKLKNYALLLFLFLAFLSLNAQDSKKLFFNLASQPNINNVTSVAASDDHLSVLVSYSVSGSKYAYLRVYDGSTWFSTDSFLYTGTLNRVMSFKNDFYICGKFASIDGKAAPSGKCISLLHLKNNLWDSLNNSALPDTIKLKAATCNDEGIYIHSESSKKLSELFFLNPSTGVINTYKVVCNLPSYGSLSISANEKRFIAYPNAGSLISVNGSSVGNLFSIKSGTLSTPSLNGGSMLAASVDLNGDIIYNTDMGSLMNKWNGSSSSSIAYNLGSKVFGAIPVTCSNDAWYLPGILNGTSNTMYVLEKTGNTWYTIPFKKTNEWVVYSKNLGTFNIDNKTFLVSRLENAALISGYVFHDADSNCLQNNGEKALPFHYVSYKDNANTYETLSDNNGYYYIPVPKGKYQLGQLPDHLKTGNCSFPNDSILWGQLDTINIPLHSKFEREIDVILIAGSGRWGDPSKQTILVRNMGNVSRTCNLNFRVPDNTSYTSSNPSASVSGKLLQWSVALNGLEEKRYTVNLHLDTSKSKPRDTLRLHAWLDNYGSDVDTSNNRVKVIKLITAAYDPNSKHSVPEGDVADLKTPILYTINFQNLGNDYARHVVVRDTLDAKLSAESIEIIASSHPLKADLENGVLVFSFSNINLDYSARNVEASKGWVSFRIRAVEGLALQTVIPNAASIYFDFNSAIVTNTAKIRLVESNENSVQSAFVKNGIKVYPNPTRDLINIESLDIKGELMLYNVQGEMLHQQTVEAGSNTQLNLGHLSPGIYLITLGGTSFKVVLE